MNKSQRKRALAIARRLLPPEDYERFLGININDTGFGFDQFGLEKETTILAMCVVQYIYKHYFRVLSDGIENVPLKGKAIIAANHSGVLPIDAAMVASDLIFKMDQPRILRSMVDNFMGFLPFVNTFFCRLGQVVGARRNFRDLLQSDEIVAVFPEGAKALGKRFTQRYQLYRFNVGFIELSLTHKAPIIPTAVIGAEEQAPLLLNIKPLARALGFPYFPITATFPWLGPIGIVPLPTQYHIHYGKPIRFFDEYPPETVKDPEKVRMLADQAQIIVQDMINNGLDARESVFGFQES